MSRTHVILVLAISISVSALGGCGGDGGVEPHIIRVQSRDVVLNAVESLEIVMQPTMGRRFAPLMPITIEDPDSEAGLIELRVSAAGEYVFRANQAWVVAHEVETTAGPFAVEIPFYASADATDDPSVDDPTIIGRVMRRGETITDDSMSMGFIQYPVPEGGRSMVFLKCSPDTPLQCTNNDP